MKTRLLVLGLLFSVVATKAQNNIVLDTIYANDTMNVTLFFPETIRQAIVGSNNYMFTYNREAQQYFGLLQAQPGTASNLLAITNDGQVYSYIIKYAESISKLNYFIPKSESIGNEKPDMDTINTGDKSAEKKLEAKTTEYKRFCDYLLKLKHEAMSSRRKDGMVLKLLDKTYYKDNVYLVFEIKNKSGIDFEIDYLKVSTITGTKRRKSSYQGIAQLILYKHNMPTMIRNKNTNKLVYVLPKFVMCDNEKLQLELNELKGNRSVRFVCNL